MYVVNERDTADARPRGYDSWLAFWKAKSGTHYQPRCCVKGCNEQAEDGAHVYKAGSVSSMSYIVPMCHEHNTQFGSELEIKDNTKLISAPR